MTLDAMEGLKVRLGFANAKFFLASGMARGMALLWRLWVVLTVSDISRYFFDVYVNDAGVKWRLLCYYRPLYGELRAEF